MTRVLIIDDNGEFAQTHAAKLRKDAGYIVDKLVSSDQAQLANQLQSMLKRTTYDLVLLDTSLPDPLALAQILEQNKIPFLCLNSPLDDNLSLITAQNLKAYRGFANKSEASTQLNKKCGEALAQADAGTSVSNPGASHIPPALRQSRSA